MWCFVSLVVSTGANNCLKRLVSEMTCCASSGTLNPTQSFTHFDVKVWCCNLFLMLSYIDRRWSGVLCIVGSTKTPRSKQKRVARLDKIMDDMKRHQMMDEEAVRESSPSGQAAALEKWKAETPCRLHLVKCEICRQWWRLWEESFVHVQGCFFSRWERTENHSHVVVICGPWLQH